MPLVVTYLLRAKCGVSHTTKRETNVATQMTFLKFCNEYLRLPDEDSKRFFENYRKLTEKDKVDLTERARIELDIEIVAPTV